MLVPTILSNDEVDFKRAVQLAVVPVLIKKWNFQKQSMYVYFFLAKQKKLNLLEYICIYHSNKKSLGYAYCLASHFSKLLSTAPFVQPLTHLLRSWNGNYLRDFNAHSVNHFPSSRWGYQLYIKTRFQRLSMSNNFYENFDLLHFCFWYTCNNSILLSLCVQWIMYKYTALQVLVITFSM